MIASRSRLLTRLALIPGLALASALALTSPAQSQKIPSDFFGMHDSQVANGSVPTVKLGATRLWDTGTAWRQIETAPGVFDWGTTDAAVENARAAGMRPLLVLGQTPTFYASRPNEEAAYGLGAASPPMDIATWKRYVTATAKRYGTKVDYQIWNEANVINYWSGSVGEMAKLTATGSQAITKVVGKKATVVAPAFPLRLGSQQKYYKKFWAAKVGGKSVVTFVDVVSVNPYPLPEQGPEASLSLIRFGTKALPKVARKKPMWNTEINYGLAQGGSGESTDISAAKQAAFVGRTLLLNAGAKMRRVYWYSWASEIGNTRLVGSDRVTLTQAGKAWQVSRGWIAGTDFKGCKKTATGRLKGLYTCTTRESRTEVRRFYWMPSGKTVTVKTPTSTTSWTDLKGDRTARKGRFGLKVGQAPVMVTSRR